MKSFRTLSKRLYKMKILLLLYTIVVATHTNVILTFDDGWSEHLNISHKLDEFNMKGTFYINSLRVNRSYRLTLQQLTDIAIRGHEVGGHTETHINLSDQSYETQYTQICNDRRRLLDWGFNVTSFAYPYGADTYESFDILSMCGYNSARDSGGIRTNTSCGNCPTVESNPPGNPLQLRSVSYRTDMGVEGLKDFVFQSLSRNVDEYIDGAIVFVFHEYGYDTTKEANITPEELTEFLTWLASQQDISVKTVDDFIGGEKQAIFDVPTTNYRIGTPYISFTFDDGTVDHLQVAGLLQNHSFRGTFFINSKNLNRNGFLTNNDIRDLHIVGHEIGGHTRTGAHLYQLTHDELVKEICDDKTKLSDLINDNVTSIAWPYGESNNDIENIARGCGYLRGRDVGGIRVPTSCGSCPSSVDIPTDNTMRLRSFVVKSYHRLGDLMWQVLRAEESYTNNLSNPKSVLIFTFHRVCDGCANSPVELENFVRWLKTRENRGTSVRLLKDLI